MEVMEVILFSLTESLSQTLLNMSLDIKWQSTVNFLECYEVEYAMGQGMPPVNIVGTIYEPKAELRSQYINDDFKDYLATKTCQRPVTLPYNTLSANSIIVLNQGNEYIKNQGSIYSIYNMKDFSRLDLHKTYLTIPSEEEGPTFFTENKDRPILSTPAQANRNGYSFHHFGTWTLPKLYYGGYHLPTKPGDSKVQEYSVPELPEKTDKKLLKEVIDYLNREKKQIMDEIDELKVNIVMKEHLKAWAYDFMFQQFDMILILIVRAIQLPRPLERVRLHYLFIQNMYGSFGAYVRIPMSVFTNTIDGMENYWIHVTDIKSICLYQNFRTLVMGGNAKPIPLIVTGDMLRSYEISEPERLRLFNSLENISKSIEPLAKAKHNLSLALPNLKVGQTYEYEPTFRDKKLKNARLEYWNLTRWYIPDDPHAWVGAEVKEINDTKYALWEYGTLGSGVLDPEGDIIYQDMNEETALDTSIDSGRIKINGMEFDLKDIQLFYNTHLFDLIRYSGEKEFVIPNITHNDLTLMRDLFKGRISLLYFYENISRYMYIEVSGPRTMIDIFDLLPVRYFILEVYSPGLPLRQQLRKIEYGNVGTIGRLDELIQITSSDEQH